MKDELGSNMMRALDKLKAELEDARKEIRSLNADVSDLLNSEHCVHCHINQVNELKHKVDKIQAELAEAKELIETQKRAMVELAWSDYYDHKHYAGIGAPELADFVNSRIYDAMEKARKGND